MLTAAEATLFAQTQPFGFILFGRNCQSPPQVAALVAALRAAVGRADVPVLIDQEGGRVARLKPPFWPALPAARVLGRLAEGDEALGLEAAALHGRLTALMLQPLGIDVDCAPVADLALPQTHAAIGDRAFAAEPLLVARLARAWAEGLMAGGVLPVVKHLPGHGRASVDSHISLPVVDCPIEVLEGSDFKAMAALHDLPLGMVAHVVYTAVDASQPASVSAPVIRDVVRGFLSFDGLLFSDDLSMQALSGGIEARAAAVLAAGCDVALCCTGIMEDMAALAQSVPCLSMGAQQRWRRARASLPAALAPCDAVAARARLAHLLALPEATRSTTSKEAFSL